MRCAKRRELIKSLYHLESSVTAAVVTRRLPLLCVRVSALWHPVGSGWSTVFGSTLPAHGIGNLSIWSLFRDTPVSQSKYDATGRDMPAVLSVATWNKPCDMPNPYGTRRGRITTFGPIHQKIIADLSDQGRSPCFVSRWSVSAGPYHCPGSPLVLRIRDTSDHCML